MKQMRAPNAPVVAQMPYGDVQCGFMRNGGGRIFFLAAHGSETIPFPVLEDGSVLAHSNLDGLEQPVTVVDLVHPRDLGITELRWTQPPWASRK